MLSIPLGLHDGTFEDAFSSLYNRLDSTFPFGAQQRQLDLFDHSNWDRQVRNWLDHSRDNWDRQMRSVRSSFIPFNFADLPLTSFPESTRSLLQSGRHDGHNAFDLSKDLYELGDDGKMHFKLRFDATGYAPEDIQLQTDGKRLTFHAASKSNTKNGESFRETSRSISVPEGVDSGKFSGHITKDGVLEVVAPVQAPDYKKIGYTKGRLGILPSWISPTAANGNDADGKQLAVLNKSGFEVLPLIEGSEEKKAHIELPVDEVYKPGDIHVMVDRNKLCVRGCHEEVRDGATSTKKFSQVYDLPESLDPLTVRTELHDGRLVVEAPLKFVKNVPIKMDK